jgi:N-acetylglucosamine kinase-like BadF-type ATPase
VAFYLGIDGGGSKTLCCVGDETLQLAAATAGPSNITRVGEARARESLHQTIREACAAARIDPQNLRRACIGVAGAGREEIAGAVRKIVAEIIPGEIEVVGDMQIALEAAFGAGPGVIVIAGTGSIAYGRDSSGRTARAGGWGFAISDEGSAHWIGRTAVATLLRAVDQDDPAAKDDGVPEPSRFFHELRAGWNLNSIEQVARTANSNPDFAALFPAVLSAAHAGDALARGVLAQAGGELAQLAGLVLRRLFAGGNKSLPLAMAGGVFRYSETVREVFCSEVRKLDGRVEVNQRVVDPVAGALEMARNAGRIR